MRDGTRSYFDSHKPKRRLSSQLTTGLVLVAAVAVFFVGVKWFRSQPAEPTLTPEYPDVSDVASASTVSSLSESPRADMYSVVAGGETGQATRDIEDGQFHHVVKATLPDINTETEYYEGWLLRPVPFDYFSTGDMVHNVDGDWVLEWFGEANKDYSAYTRVIVTREPKDGNPAPDVHILEGEF